MLYKFFTDKLKLPCGYKEPPEKPGVVDSMFTALETAEPPYTALIRSERWFTTETYLRQADRADWQYTDPQLRLFTGLFIAYMRKQKIPIYAHNAFRTRQQQDSLFAQGRSKLRWPRASHAQGKAVDLVHSDLHWEGMVRPGWQYLGAIGKQIAASQNIPIIWGGDWKSFPDPAHWELENWRDDIRQIIPTSPIKMTPVALLKDVRGAEK